MMWSAGFGKSTTVGANMVNQTVGFESIHVHGPQSWTIGGNEKLSLENAWGVSVKSQAAAVGGNQDITINATGSTKTGSESVSIGANLIELVGDPKSGMKGFADAAMMSVIGEVGGPIIGKIAAFAKTGKEAYEKGGLKGLGMAAAQTAVSELASHFQADAIASAADAAGLTPWSEKAQERAAEEEAGGGAGGPGAAGPGAAAAAPGHRKIVVDGSVTEIIGAAHLIQTPGSLKWTTLGAASFAIGGSHTTSAVRIHRTTIAASSDKAAAMSITARSAIGRNVKTVHTIKAGGVFNLDASGSVNFKASGSLSLTAGGSMTLDGGNVVFDVGSGASTVSVHGGGLTLKSASITIHGKTINTAKASVG
jgi:type VI secretion system secreted protein VgrG